MSWIVAVLIIWNMLLTIFVLALACHVYFRENILNDFFDEVHRKLRMIMREIVSRPKGSWSEEDDPADWWKNGKPNPYE